MIKKKKASDQYETSVLYWIFYYHAYVIMWLWDLNII